MSYTKILSFYLENDPCKKDLSPQERAYLISNLQVIEPKAEETLYSPKTPPNVVYFLAQGRVTLHTSENEAIVVRPGEYFGEEVALGLHTYASKAVAEESCHIISISAQDFYEILKKNSLLQERLLTNYSKKFVNSTLSPQKNLGGKSVQTDPASSLPELRWGISLILPLFFYVLFKNSFPEQDTVLFLSFSLGAACLWIFRLIPSYIPPFMVVMASLVLELAPKEVTLSGFSSENFLMLFSILALGQALASSHLLSYIMLRILKFMPPTPFWTNISVFMLGVFCTPLIPLSTNRQELFKDFTKNFTCQLGIPSSTPSAFKLALSAYGGCTLFGPVFITSSIYNFLVFNLLMTNQDRFFSSEWFLNALPAGVFLLIFFAIGLNLFFKDTDRPAPFRERIETQIQVLGKLDNRARGLCLVSVLYLLVLGGRNYHGISPTYICMTMFLILIIFNLISMEELKKKLDWPALFLFALLTGVISTFNVSELSFARPLMDFLDQIVKRDFPLFVLILGLALSLARIFIPYGLTVVIAICLLFPFAQQESINPWLMGFLILLFSKESLLPSSSSNLKDFMLAVSDQPTVPYSCLWKYHLMIAVIKFAAVYFSILFWKDMSLI